MTNLRTNALGLTVSVGGSRYMPRAVGQDTRRKWSMLKSLPGVTVWEIVLCSICEDGWMGKLGRTMGKETASTGTLSLGFDTWTMDWICMNRSTLYDMFCMGELGQVRGLTSEPPVTRWKEPSFRRLAFSAFFFVLFFWIVTTTINARNIYDFLI